MSPPPPPPLPVLSYKTTQQLNGVKIRCKTLIPFRLTFFGMLVCFHTSQCENTNQYNKQVNQKQISILHLIFHRLTVVYVLLCSLKEGIAPKIRMLCSVKINSVSLNLLYVCMFRMLTAVPFFFSFLYFQLAFFLA